MLKVMGFYIVLLYVNILPIVDDDDCYIEISVKISMAMAEKEYSIHEYCVCIDTFLFISITCYYLIEYMFACE